MGQWPRLFSQAQLSESHNAHFKSLVQSIVFKNVGLYFNQTLQPQPKFDGLRK